jgi:hypothetical protein
MGRRLRPVAAIALATLAAVVLPGTALASPVVTPPASLAVATGNSGALTGAAISGFDPSADIRVVLGVDSGTLTLTTLPTGVTIPFGYPSAGTAGANVAFEGVQAQVDVALGDLEWTPSGTGAATLTINAVLGGPAYDPANGHYYEAVNNGSDISWSAARSAALAMTFNGLPGYLATITSQAENSFLAATTSSAAWIGGTEDSAYGAPGSGAHTTNYTWTDGPEQGEVFWVPSCGMGLQGICGATGMFSHFNGGEPNDAGAVEHYLQFVTGGGGNWNDLSIASAGVPVYLVEFGGTGQTPTDAASTTQTLTGFTTPGAPTGVSVTVGTQSATVSWTAPASTGGSAITGYTVTSYVGGSQVGTTTVSPGTTSVALTGLTGGTAYTFKVSATNLAGPGALSTASAAVTPLVPTTVTLTSSNTTPSYGDGAVLTATVAGLSPTGTIVFREAGILLGTVALGSGHATLAVNALSVGAHAYTAQ